MDGPTVWGSNVPPDPYSWNCSCISAFIHFDHPTNYQNSSRLYHVHQVSHLVCWQYFPWRHINWRWGAAGASTMHKATTLQWSTVRSSSLQYLLNNTTDRELLALFVWKLQWQYSLNHALHIIILSVHFNVAVLFWSGVCPKEAPTRISLTEAAADSYEWNTVVQFRFHNCTE